MEMLCPNGIGEMVKIAEDTGICNLSAEGGCETIVCPYNGKVVGTENEALVDL